MLLAGLSLAGGSAQAADREDFGFLSEHLLESGVDSRYAGLPWTAGRIERGRWQYSLQAGYSDTGNALMDLRGPMLAAGLAFDVRDSWAIEGMAFVDSLDVGGEGGREDLHPLIADVDVPLDLPNEAVFSEPRGRLAHRGVGLSFVHQFRSSDPRRFWSLHGGVMWERYEARDVATRYLLAAGADAGVAGVIDYSSTYDFGTPYLMAEVNRPLGSRFDFSPRALLVVPLPRQSFDVALSAPGFEIRGTSPTRPIGDTYVGLGLEIRDRRSGLAADLGTSLTFPFVEELQHPGIDRALTFQLVWHSRRHPSHG